MSTYLVEYQWECYFEDEREFEAENEEAARIMAKREVGNMSGSDLLSCLVDRSSVLIVSTKLVGQDADDREQSYYCKPVIIPGQLAIPGMS